MSGKRKQSWYSINGSKIVWDYKPAAGDPAQRLEPGKIVMVSHVECSPLPFVKIEVDRRLPTAYFAVTEL